MGYALLISIVVGLVSTGVFLVLWMVGKADLAVEKNAHAETQSQLTAATSGTRISEDGRNAEKARYEGIIAALHSDITRLEADLATCSSPDAVRSRLRGMLSVLPEPVSAAPAGGSEAAFGSVPFGGTSTAG